MLGNYVDTITVTAPGATNSPLSLFDAARHVTPVVINAAMIVGPATRSTTVQQGTIIPGASATVTMSGVDGWWQAWSATARSSWLSLAGKSGTGTGTITWSHDASALAAGVYVDTITVSAAAGVTGSPALIIDTLHVTAAVTPLVLAISPIARSATAVQGSAAPGDNATITVTGTGAASANWTATRHSSWLTLTNPNGTGPGVLSWTRNTAGLNTGLYVDTIAVTIAGASGSPATIYDSLRVTAIVSPLVVAVSPVARSATAVQGSAAPGDNATITVAGTGAASANWTATRHSSWLTLTNPNGTGTGVLSWTRNTAGLTTGLYVDTIAVTMAGASGSPATIYDSLRITPVVINAALSVSPAGRSTTVPQGGAAAASSSNVTLTGTDGWWTAWTATRRSQWLTLGTTGRDRHLHTHVDTQRQRACGRYLRGHDHGERGSRDRRFAEHDL